MNNRKDSDRADAQVLDGPQDHDGDSGRQCPQLSITSAALLMVAISSLLIGLGSIILSRRSTVCNAFSP